jgi:hypothetical protein
MKSRSLVRTATICIVIVLSAIALVAFSAVEPLLSRVAEAQDQTGEIPVGMQSPIPGVDYSDVAGGDLIESDTAPATPAVPVIPAEGEKIGEVPAGGMTTASLGGSDVAVASVGGSYQVDAPHKKKRRSTVPAP